MTTIFAQLEQAVVADAEAAVSALENFFTADVWPIIKATLQYVETNGGSDLLKIASNALSGALSSIEGGTSADAVVSAAVGTVVNEATAAGLQVAQGAAALAVSMVAAEINSAQLPAA
jgi:hypothetical protein